jgi:hypothetical protein
MSVPTDIHASPEIDELVVVDPASEAADTPHLVELILKDRFALNRLMATDGNKIELATRFLGIALAAFLLFGVAMAVAFDAAGVWPKLAPLARWLDHPSLRFVTYHAPPQSSTFAHSWLTGQAERLVIAYAFGLVATSCVCLPSLYFYSLLAGLRMSLTEVVLHTLKAKAVTAVALVGILPIYAALMLGAVVYVHSQSMDVDTQIIRLALGVGLILPFVAGLWGTRSLYVGFDELCDRMPKEFQANRACFLRRLILAWCGCYTAVAPVMIATVWQNLGRILCV